MQPQEELAQACSCMESNLVPFCFEATVLATAPPVEGACIGKTEGKEGHIVVEPYRITVTESTEEDSLE